MPENGNINWLRPLKLWLKEVEFKRVCSKTTLYNMQFFILLCYLFKGSKKNAPKEILFINFFYMLSIKQGLRIYHE